MPKPDFTLKFIKNSDDLRRLSERLISLSVFSLDIETVDWWNRHQERIALLQFAYRVEDKIRVVIVDALADLDFELLRRPLEHSSALKIIHNAAFDAARLGKHYDFGVAPVFDTMVAARRAGECRYSLRTQAEIHLAIRLDKAARTSDWSRRPLDVRQLHYSALDPFATLLLYENQTERGLTGDYRSRAAIESAQNRLPLGESPPVGEQPRGAPISPTPEATPTDAALSATAAALLGIIAELPTRYSPAALTGAVGSDRIGLAGWIVDRRLGRDAEPDEETVKMAIADLLADELIRLTETGRLEANGKGSGFWLSLK